VQLERRAAIRALFFSAILSGGFCACQAAETCVPVPAGLVAWYRGEGDAVEAFHLYHGELTGGTSFGAGAVGQAFTFDGVDDSVVVRDHSTLNPEKITLEAWVKPSVIKAGSRVVSKELSLETCDSPFVAWSLDVRSDRSNRAVFFLSVRNSSALHELPGTSAIPTDRFTHLAATFDGTRARIYVNGVQENSASVSGVLPAAGTPVVLGRPGTVCAAKYANLGEFAGQIDEVAIYNRALTAAEVLSIFAAGPSGKCPPPALRIVRDGSTGTTIRWEVALGTFRLEHTDSLLAPTWGSASEQPAIVSTEFSVSISPSNSRRFFRLRRN
jgi:hypothetical protein